MRTVWLASYPKSGNTWLRMMIGALALPEDGELDINELPERGGIASGRLAFDQLTLVDSSLLTYDEIDRLRPAVHAAQAGGLRDPDEPAEALETAARTRFVKTHDAYTRLPDGAPMLAGERGAASAVLVVRDPRDVAPSLANHSGLGLDAAIAQLCDPGFAMCAEPDRAASQLRQQLLGWSGFVDSWLAQTDLPVIVVRYEDMQADPAAALGRVMDLAGDPKSAAELSRAAALTDFARLKRREAETGFREAPLRAKGGFFRRGQAGAWREELTAEQAARVEAAHGPMMRRLGYELSPTMVGDGPASAQPQGGQTSARGAAPH